MIDQKIEKQKRLFLFSHITDDEIEGLTAQQQEVILLKNILIQSLDKWLDAYKVMALP